MWRVAWQGEGRQVNFLYRYMCEVLLALYWHSVDITGGRRKCLNTPPTKPRVCDSCKWRMLVTIGCYLCKLCTSCSILIMCPSPWQHVCLCSNTQGFEGIQHEGFRVVETPMMDCFHTTSLLTMTQLKACMYSIQLQQCITNYVLKFMFTLWKLVFMHNVWHKYSLWESQDNLCHHRHDVFLLSHATCR